MEETLKYIGTILITILGSGAFWTFWQKRADKKDGKTKLLLGIAHDRIVWLGMFYVDRGSITQDEFENLNDYLYEPYKNLGGNGTASRIMTEVQKLPIIRNIPKKGGLQE
jgi:hypothetical protein